MAESQKSQDAALAEAGVATEKENAKLEHSQGGVTTRDDGTDVGVPMLPGDPSEPQGPEDALGEGPKRGDYRNRLGGTYHTQTVRDEDGNVKIVAQNPRANDIGDAKGLKGGVDTAA